MKALRVIFFVFLMVGMSSSVLQYIPLPWKTADVEMAEILKVDIEQDADTDGDDDSEDDAPVYTEGSDNVSTILKSCSIKFSSNNAAYKSRSSSKIAPPPKRKV
jgi:hypothetical protein